MKKTPLFVAIEGVSNVAQKALSDELEVYFAVELGLAAVAVKEPSDGIIGHRIRKIIDGKLPAPKTNYEFRRLCVEDRLEHIKTCIRPHILLGNCVLSVGYWLSTLAHGMLDGSLEQCLQLHREIIGEEMIFPHLSIILDAPEDSNYIRLAEAKCFGNIHVINFDGVSWEEVLSSAIAAIKPLL
ncbi:hypothetical protein A2661_00700 [Candidatus Giovannonibacteria bacterium RIFCSPHIGHO2_01_FULL_45_24]|uniref:Thymidylate kinase-like domain-containing protein n=1 Tax=Candidatus Giovannonibacteria bacterium RIFCSPLOWO2_01_FULL_46_32 TaxID=1798353 RepID=A0A1F5XGN5_9BACT|nr:MAG: hypothetical protein A2661_00700 [Candidatus Giovannonibacteria bacterium RIFCSPHIGHO2_01_FULL_45_24]OGF87095.1 MAG: hypothetical protein A3B19_01540 [Candidatus Giovannonibacteria bacterium RIFCSPLOWO2_01_FULL_46_32]